MATAGDDDKKVETKTRKAPAHGDRLATALRENLHRRKAQARDRRQAAERGGSKND